MLILFRSRLNRVLLNKVKDRLSYKYIFKLWAFLQVFMIIGRPPTNLTNAILIIIIPIIFVSFLVIHTIFTAIAEKRVKLTEDELKIYNRDKKIKKIIKKT